MGPPRPAFPPPSTPDVLAIEIHKSNVQAPPQFAKPLEGLSRCGSIVGWTILSRERAPLSGQSSVG
jgi:hypothetical protein